MGNKLRPAIFYVIAIFILIFTAPPANSDAATPEAMVDSFHSDLLDVMKEGKKLGVKGRYEKLLNQIDTYFHMPLMVLFVTNEHWQTAPPEARHALIGAARRFGAGEMAVLFSDYAGESFKTNGTRRIQDKSVLVDTSLIQPEGSPVKLIYRVRKFGDSWRIIDVLLDGSISQLLKRRGEYRRVLAEEGLSGLTKLLNQKADEMLADKTN